MRDCQIFTVAGVQTTASWFPSDPETRGEGEQNPAGRHGNERQQGRNAQDDDHLGQVHVRESPEMPGDMLAMLLVAQARAVIHSGGEC